ncbi:hypothetical protein T265_06372 [Opisthorchis viverrini]|uniref:Uncharacterized protein n=1 Tax=Opisthorchis viverrini TaxID=6198 RepID=A0A074ZGI2_OPIVI|nr:hypothetical protein T265_06372 [Opisthorchis viverrini]KER26396.1 hypothetical protein T265_06372 [Opisthorchis viverrini]
MEIVSLARPPRRTAVQVDKFVYYINRLIGKHEVRGEQGLHSICPYALSPPAVLQEASKFAKSVHLCNPNEI